jgi:hypothetical protein
MVAGAAALLAAAIGKLGTPRQAEAGHNTNIAYDSQTVMHVDVTNTTAGSSRISSNISGTAAFVALNNYPVGISRPDGMLGRTMYTTSNCAGVAGTCENATGGLGVMGAAKSSTGTGVYGFAGSVVPSTVAPAGTGVYGSGPTNGVYGTTAGGAGIGVVGQTSSNIGVYGASSGVGTGVYGMSASAVAVGGVSTSGTGCQGSSNSGFGIYGTSSTFVGVFGTAATGTGVYGHTSAGGYAGFFEGTTTVIGAFTVMGGAKSAGVKHPDGSIRRLYCQESPEPWFEDFGRGTLEGGKADITIDPDFVAVVKSDDYDVFLTPYGDSKGLFVSKKETGRFSVQEQQGGTSKLEFSYRVVARRRDEVGKRLEKIDIKAPQVKPQAVPAAPKLPPVPAALTSSTGTPTRAPGDLADDPVQ